MSKEIKSKTNLFELAQENITLSSSVVRKKTNKHIHKSIHSTQKKKKQKRAVLKFWKLELRICSAIYGLFIGWIFLHFFLSGRVSRANYTTAWFISRAMSRDSCAFVAAQRLYWAPIYAWFQFSQIVGL